MTHQYELPAYNPKQQYTDEELYCGEEYAEIRRLNGLVHDFTKQFTKKELQEFNNIFGHSDMGLKGVLSKELCDEKALIKQLMDEHGFNYIDGKETQFMIYFDTYETFFEDIQKFKKMKAFT